VRDKFPRLTTTRRVKPDGSLYFGPYTSSQSMRETVNLIQKIFPLRSCSDAVFAQYRRAGRPCIEFQMKRCVAPCCDLVDKPRYDELVRGVTLFLRGQNRELLEDLRARMRDAAEKERFERAGPGPNSRYQADRASRVVSSDSGPRCSRGARQAEIQVLFVRQGKLLGGTSQPLANVWMDDAEAVSSLVSQYYAEDRVVPD
jgi:excinuclease ABC subunit C